MSTPVDTVWEPIRDGIKEELYRRGWTQADLARHIGFTEKHVSRALSGRDSAFGGLGLILWSLGLGVEVVKVDR